MEPIQQIRVVERKIADRHLAGIINDVNEIGFLVQKNKFDAMFWIIDAMIERINGKISRQEEI